MTEPEAALEQARRSAAAMRAAGAYADEAEDIETHSGPVTVAKLADWAMIEPDLREVRSTRRLGAPVTAVKRALLRLLGQYHADLLSQQTRFNVAIISELGKLDERIAELERRLDREHPGS